MRVGFVGLGDMGEGMATNLATKGFDLVVRDVRPEPVARLEALGASTAESNRELGEKSEAVFLAVFDDKQVIEVCLGDGDDAGVLAGLPQGGVIAVHSTVSPTTHQLLAEKAAPRGVTVVDAAMTGGGNAAAREARLTFFVGGDTEAVDRIRPALDAMAQNVFHVGALGSGVTTKIISNFLGVSNLTLVREAIRLAKAVGIEEDRILEMVGAGGVGSSFVSNNWPLLRKQEAGHTTGKAGMVAMASKDMHLALELSDETGTPMPVLQFILNNVIPDLDATGLTG